MAEFEKEVAVLVQRVVRDISNAFKKNPNIDEIGIIPCPEPRYNRSPIVLIETKLGLESWCVKFLLPSLHRKLLLYRQRKNYLDREALVDVTVTLLLLNPDFTTAWNIRKELLQCGLLNPEKDLYLGKLALTRFPKSPETWIHRRWVILQFLQQCCAQKGCRKEQCEGYLCHTEAMGSSQNLCTHQAKLLHQEMSVCSEAAGRYPSNYNAWSHRIWVLQHIAKDNVEVFLEEFSSMRRWVSMHVSDHSGFHYRQFLLQALLTELCKAPHMSTAGTTLYQQGTTTTSPSARLTETRAAFGLDPSGTERQLGGGTIAQLFDLEMEFCSELIHSYPGHEALWCHRRQVVFLWHKWRRDHPHFPCNTNEGNGLHLSISKDNGQAFSSVEGSINGLPCGDAMEVDGPPDPCNAKQLKGGPLMSGSLALTAEHSFVSILLDDCGHSEQRRFALAYRKWLGNISRQ
ncbi:protein prenyltransferase alpha subunit repeat-containing protein 1 [Gadus morhua]|uniref:Protein prenyltransferase alpha subunit repeat containing 1 n=1 Tax=Gadus morhua TaxID=8049 RepID=A0A8C4ZMG6_GADMO|nr:protein prenyltransferase alpha subunit repeat-containing protein 1 [Gadus morhua]